MSNFTLLHNITYLVTTARAMCSKAGLVTALCCLGAVAMTLYTYRTTVYWDRKAGMANWVKLNFRECAFDGGFQKCYEPLWTEVVRNIIPLALVAQAVAFCKAQAARPTGRSAKKFLPSHEYNLSELRHRHVWRVAFLKVLFLCYLGYHVSTFEPTRQLYGPTKGNARTQLTHTLSWLVSIPFGTLPVLLLGWTLDAWLSTFRGRTLTTASTITMAVAAVTEGCLVFTAFGTLLNSVESVAADGVQSFVSTPLRSIVLLAYVIRIPVSAQSTVLPATAAPLVARF